MISKYQCCLCDEPLHYEQLRSDGESEGQVKQIVKTNPPPPVKMHQCEVVDRWFAHAKCIAAYGKDTPPADKRGIEGTLWGDNP